MTSELIQGKYYSAILADLADKREHMRALIDLETLSGIAEDAAGVTATAATMIGDPKLVEMSAATAEASERQRTSGSKRLGDT